MGQDYCEFNKMTFGTWLRCGACLHTKAGFLLVAAGGTALWLGPMGLGKGLLAAGMLLLAYSLIKDILVIARRRNPSGPKDQKAPPRNP